MMLLDNSVLCSPPMPISERQVIFLDGIRYSADMASIALNRLWEQLCLIDSLNTEVKSHHIASASLDAWSIIDAAHRMSDLIRTLPGLPHAPWRRLFQDRTSDARDFRNMWQHQNTEAPAVVGERGQAWGAIAWVKHIGTQPTGDWFVAVAGSSLDASRLTFVGPMNPIEGVSTRRIRLLHMGRQIYLCRLVKYMFEAVSSLEDDLASGKLRLKGDNIGKPLPKDWVMHSSMAVIIQPKEQVSDKLSKKGAE